MSVALLSNAEIMASLTLTSSRWRTVSPELLLFVCRRICSEDREMDRRLFWWFCVLAALGSVRAADPAMPKISIIDNKKLTCVNGNIHPTPKTLTEDVYDTYTCCDNNGEHCSKITVKVLSEESLIQLDMGALISVLMSDVIVTAMIGWAVYSVCAQSRVRSTYQGSKASDRVNLISNHSAGDTYQPLNTRSDEYSTLHGPRKQKNPKHPI